MSCAKLTENKGMHAREVKTSLLATVKISQGADRQGTDSSTSAKEMLTKVATLFACRYNLILSGEMRLQDYC